MTEKDNKRATESLILLVQKQSGKIKAKIIENGSAQRAYTNRYNAESPTAARNAIIITGVVEAKQGRYVMINYVPNDFLQTTVSQD